MSNGVPEWLEGQADRLLNRQRAAVENSKLIATFITAIAATIVATCVTYLVCGICRECSPGVLLLGGLVLVIGVRLAYREKSVLVGFPPGVRIGGLDQLWGRNVRSCIGERLTHCDHVGDEAPCAAR
jgi:hypothetical protein